MSFVHGGHLSLWDTRTEFTLSKFWKEWFIASRIGSQSGFSCWSRLILVFYVLLWFKSHRVLITSSITWICWHLFFLLTSNRMFHSSDMAWMSLSLHHFHWFWQSSSPPDRGWLVHLLLLVKLVIVLALRALVVEPTGCPSWLICRDRLLHWIAIFWVFWILRLQSWHISLSFCTFSNRYTAFYSVQRKSFLSRVNIWKILRGFAGKFSSVLHRLCFVPTSYSHLNTRFLEIEFCTFHILLSFHNSSKIETR